MCGLKNRPKGFTLPFAFMSFLLRCMIKPKFVWIIFALSENHIKTSDTNNLSEYFHAKAVRPHLPYYYWAKITLCGRIISLLMVNLKDVHYKLTEKTSSTTLWTWMHVGKLWIYTSLDFASCIPERKARTTLGSRLFLLISKKQPITALFYTQHSIDMTREGSLWHESSTKLAIPLYYDN